MKGRKPLFSSQTVHHATPKALFDELHREFGFDFDPCPLGSLVDGLATPWTGKRVYCNPPYGREIPKWLAKATEADIAVYLLPARTDTRWFHEYAMKAQEIRFVKGRLKFGVAKYNAPFPNCVVIFKQPVPGEGGKDG